MISKEDLDPYKEREHAKAKHSLLKEYVERYAMILGQRAKRLSFVDAFAGPWLSATDELTDTSFGLSVSTLRGCAETLGARFQRRPEIHALWIEQDPAAYERLRAFAETKSDSRVKIQTLNASFQSSIDYIVDFLGTEAHGFVFIDPKGYAGLIEPAVLAPLLSMPRVEVLINHMWSHIKWAFGSGKAGDVANLRKLYGSRTDQLLSHWSGKRLEVEATRAYEAALREACAETGDRRLRVMSYPICDTRGQRLPKYFLVHGTHDARGLNTFAEACDKANAAQDQIFIMAEVMRQEDRIGVDDLFSSGTILPSLTPDAPNTEAWLTKLPTVGDEAVIDAEAWATMLEANGCLPNSLQLGLKRLIDDGVLQCEAAKRRRKRFVHYDEGKGEVVRRIA
ncbi:three-Cys-motif partner protein [Dokdonella fugitiva]|uniref:Three-Cys-motif partner protein n=1 Tax=Dokdonella fugitiva TaxID=328517 RepID=A0A839F889_9GAMM|nr:three-Cys-motif partner protein TcmP [Dokdonella fugitiva]MBA8889290.1 three-Cys-motif partner protein [Dokdonella fugitiva]